jgi:hypothetical protein
MIALPVVQCTQQVEAQDSVIEAVWRATTAEGGSLTKMPIVRQANSSSPFVLETGRPLIIIHPISRKEASSRECTARFAMQSVAGTPLPKNANLMVAQLHSTWNDAISISIASKQPAWSVVCDMEMYRITMPRSSKQGEIEVDIEFASQLSAMQLAAGGPFTISGTNTAVQLRPVADRAKPELRYTVAQRIVAAAAVTGPNLLLLAKAGKSSSSSSNAEEQAAAAAAAQAQAEQLALQFQAPDGTYSLSALTADTISKVVYTSRGTNMAALGTAAEDVYKDGG